MRKIVLLFVICTWALAACAGPATEVESTPTIEAIDLTGPATETPSEVVVETATTDSAVAPTATENTPETAAASNPPASSASGVVTYRLAPDESSLTYEVGEVFIDQGNVFAVAVGVTNGVSGDIQVDFDRPQETTVGALTADISGFRSDSSRRDSAIRSRYLQSAQYPLVTFTPTTISGLPETIVPGQVYPLTLQGDLTIRETTRPAVFEAQVVWQENILTGQAATTFLMSDFGFGPIDILGVLKTEDEVKITVDFVARPD